MKQPAPTPAKPAPVTPTPAPAVLRSKETTPSPTPKISSAKPGRGEPLEQVLPEVPAKAMSTIQGTVRVVVKVHADAAGNVTEAEFDTPGPSKYFADLALKAARRWVFSSPEVDGRSAASDWLIQFGFSQAGVKASATQTQP